MASFQLFVDFVEEVTHDSFDVRRKMTLGVLHPRVCPECINANAINFVLLGEDVDNQSGNVDDGKPNFVKLVILLELGTVEIPTITFILSMEIG